MKYLAVDLGASSGRTIVADLTPGRIELTETHRFSNGFIDRAGSKVWPFEKIMTDVRKGIANSGKIDGIGLDTWGVDFGYIDKSGNLLADPYAYRDARSERAMPAVYERISRERLYEIAGMQEMTFNSVFQVMADMLERPALLERAAQLLFTPDLIAHALTGDSATEYTVASTSGMLDAATRTWSSEILDALGAPRHLFGQVDFPGTKQGSYNGIPVCLAPSHDTASAVAAVPATGDPDWCYISSGTWSLVGAELDAPVCTVEARDSGFTNEGGVAGKIRFLTNVNGMWLIQECQRIWAEQGQNLTFAEIASAATACAGFSSKVDPADNRFLAPDNMIELVQSCCRETDQPVPETVGEIARCCYESLAASYATVITRLEAVSGRSFNRIHVVGGGCQATLLNQLTADACQRPVIAGPVEATAIGNVSVQALAQGVFANLAELRAAVAAAFETTVYTPR